MSDLPRRPAFRAIFVSKSTARRDIVLVTVPSREAERSAPRARPSPQADNTGLKPRLTALRSRYGA